MGLKVQGSEVDQMDEAKMNELQVNFDQIRQLLIPYRPPLVSKVDDASHFDLWSVKDMTIEGRKRKEVYFAGLIIQKAYVGFYFMPVYVQAEMKEIFAPELLRLLKGKSCFHIKKLDDQLIQQITNALEAGFKLYVERGWIEVN